MDINCEAVATIVPSIRISHIVANDLDTLHSVLKFQHVDQFLDTCIHESLITFYVTLVAQI